jgi:asparagine synthetase B (glutamine-hydrolysing)
VSAIRVVGELDETLAWDGERLYHDADLGPDGGDASALRGAAGTVSASSRRNRWRVVRDPLGLNKLFWAREPAGGIVFAARPWLLVEQGYALDDVSAVPRGTQIDLEPDWLEPRGNSLVPDAWSNAAAEEVDLEAVGREIRVRLERYLEALAARHRGAPPFVCLSGGLDSSAIAVLIAERFPDAVAVSFDLRRSGGGASEDRRVAARLARELGLPLLEATVTLDQLLEPLDTVLREGIDWRDFNVHAALVNAALADAIADAAGSVDARPLVFTGDLANEFLADYEPERYRGKTYYPLPRLEPGALRALLVRGLDTCHREIGVFEHWGLTLVQPYAVAVDTYMHLPDGFLRAPDRKQRLCHAMLGDTMPRYVLTRDKTRAQVGGDQSGGGVLAACVERGIDESWLRRRFAELHRVEDERSLDRFIRAGRYRAAQPSNRGDDDRRA